MSTNQAAIFKVCESEYSHLQNAMRAPAHLGSKSLNLRFALMRIPRERRFATRNGRCHGSPQRATRRTREARFGHLFSRSAQCHEAWFWPPRSCFSSLRAPRERTGPSGRRPSASGTACSVRPGSLVPPGFAVRCGLKTRRRPAIPGSTRWPTNRNTSGSDHAAPAAQKPAVEPLPRVA